MKSSWSFQSSKGLAALQPSGRDLVSWFDKTSEAFFDACLAADPWEVTTGGSGSSVSTCQSLPSDCETTIRIYSSHVSWGTSPLFVVRMRTICNRTLDLLGFCHEDGLPSHLMCVVRNSATKHIQCDGTPFLPAVGRIPAVAASHWNFEIPGCDLQQD